MALLRVAQLQRLVVDSRTVRRVGGAILSVMNALRTKWLHAVALLAVVLVVLLPAALAGSSEQLVSRTNLPGNGDRLDLASPALELQEDFMGEVVTYLEHSRTEWGTLTLVRMTVAPEDRYLVGVHGDTRLLIADHDGWVSYDVTGPVHFWLGDITGDGAEELVLSADPTGFSGCCHHITVMTQTDGGIERLFHLDVFGGMRLQDLGGDGDYAIVGWRVLQSDVVPNVDRVRIPFVCAWSGTELVDETATTGRYLVEEAVEDVRIEIAEAIEARNANSLVHLGHRYVALAFLLDDGTAGPVAAMIEQELLAIDPFGSTTRYDIWDLHEDALKYIQVGSPCR